MNEQKKGTISERYFIRSALSQISKNKDIILDLKKRREGYKDARYNPDSFYTKEKETISKRINCLKKGLFVIEQRESVVQKEINKLCEQINACNLKIRENNPTNWRKKLKNRILLLLLSILTCFILFILWFKSNSFFVIMLIVGAVLWVILELDTLINHVHKEADFKKHISEKLILLNHEINDLKEKKAILEKQIAKYSDQRIAVNNEIQLSESKKQKLNKKYEYDFKEKQNSIITNINNQIINCKNSSLSLYKSLKKTVIDERDWENLDIIIYELETGRAETIKEALQQTDMLIRHNEIKQAISRAASAICISIEQNMSEINYSIERNMARIHDDFISLSDDQRRTQESLNDLVSAQELSNALKEKANVSSAQLAEDVRRLRELKDYEYYGHSN